MTVKEIREAIEGLADETPVELRLGGDLPEDWDLMLSSIGFLEGRKGEPGCFVVLIDPLPPDEEEEEDDDE